MFLARARSPRFAEPVHRSLQSLPSSGQNEHVLDRIRRLAIPPAYTAVCRKSYINPIVFLAWRAGALTGYVPKGPVTPRKLETLALALLRKHSTR